MNLIYKFGFALGVLMTSTTPALAQSNLPYTHQGVGMSPAYRQAILNDKLLGSRPSDLIRGPSGQLLDVQRRDNQVFLRSPDDGAFLPGFSPNRGWSTGLGTGLGWGGTFASAGSGNYAPGAWTTGDSLTNWISMLPADEGQTYWGGLGAGAGSSPMDIWIRQL